MKLACLSFTASGEHLASIIRQSFLGEVGLFTKDTYKANLDRIFSEYDGVAFISATGIAVRLSAPFLISKKDDPAIVVIDDMGQYVISLVSGHLGGANELAKTLAEILNARPIITTASDNRGFEAIDLFAKRTGLVIEDFEQVKRVTAMMVEGAPIQFQSILSDVIDYPNLVDSDPRAVITVDVKQTLGGDIPGCALRPKVLAIGVGCRKGKPKAAILSAIQQVFTQHNLSLRCVRYVVSIDIKKEEAGLIETADELSAETIFYSARQLKTVSGRFDQSDFVEETTGVGAVCEAAAYLATENLIVPKTIIDGVTIAVGQQLR